MWAPFDDSDFFSYGNQSQATSIPPQYRSKYYHCFDYIPSNVLLFRAPGRRDSRTVSPERAIKVFMDMLQVITA
jgi:NADH:ubiquinone oxidoreductase subunit